MDSRAVFPYTKTKRGEGRPVRLEVHIDPNCAETVVTITAPAMTDDLRALAAQMEGAPPLLGWQGDAAVPLDPAEVLCFYAANKEVYARTPTGEYLLRLRLYELEERLDPARFVRISHSEIVNLKRITALDLSLAGTIKMTLTAGPPCYVSRRYVPKIKQALGLGRGRTP